MATKHNPYPPKINIGISACLLGEKVRYNGSHKFAPYIATALGRIFNWIPLCPEVEVGMPIPREAIQLVGTGKPPHLLGITSAKDWTPKMQAYAFQRLNLLAKENLCGFIFKSKSPSCGKEGVQVFNKKGTVIGKSAGIFSYFFQQHFPLIPIEDEQRLSDPDIRNNFIEQVFAYQRHHE